MGLGRLPEVKNAFVWKGHKVARAAGTRDRLAETDVCVAGNELQGIADGLAKHVHVKSLGHGMTDVPASELDRTFAPPDPRARRDCAHHLQRRPTLWPGCWDIGFPVPLCCSYFPLSPSDPLPRTGPS
jgi:hypothetical protein